MGHCGSAVAMPTEIAATWERTARAATAKATSSGTPARTSATPSVTGPTNCHLIGWSYPAS